MPLFISRSVNGAASSTGGAVLRSLFGRFLHLGVGPLGPGPGGGLIYLVVYPSYQVDVRGVVYFAVLGG